MSEVIAEGAVRLEETLAAQRATGTAHHDADRAPAMRTDVDTGEHIHGVTMSAVAVWIFFSSSSMGSMLARGM